jgi:hypothetical protein
MLQVRTRIDLLQIGDDSCGRGTFDAGGGTLDPPAEDERVNVRSQGNATGPLVANWVAFKTNWHWVYWVQLCSNAVVFVLCLLSPSGASHIALPG